MSTRSASELLVAEAQQGRAQQLDELALLSRREDREDLAFGVEMRRRDAVDEVDALLREADDHLPAVTCRCALDQPALLEPIDSIRHRSGRDHRLANEVAGR